MGFTSHIFCAMIFIYLFIHLYLCLKFSACTGSNICPRHDKSDIVSCHILTLHWFRVKQLPGGTEAKQSPPGEETGGGEHGGEVAGTEK